MNACLLCNTKVLRWLHRTLSRSAHLMIKVCCEKVSLPLPRASRDCASFVSAFQSESDGRSTIKTVRALFWRNIESWIVRK